MILISFRLVSKMLAMPVFKCTALVLILQAAGFVLQPFYTVFFLYAFFLCAEYIHFFACLNLYICVRFLQCK